MKRLFFFISVLVSAVEFPLFSLAEKEIKLWMLCSLFAVVFFAFDFLKKDFSVFKRSRIFYLGIIIIISALLALINSPRLGFSFNQILVFATLLPLAVFWEINFAGLKKEGYAALALGMILSCIYAIYQNIAFDKGWSHFEVMAARPNAFFYEPDWLGFYLALGLIPFLNLLIFKKTLGKNFSFFGNRFNLLFFNILIFTGILLTVARSGWLALIGGFLVMTGADFLKLWGWKKDNLLKALKKGSLSIVKFLLLIAVAYSAISIFGLSRFNLADRFRSIFFKEHIITLAFNEANGEKFKINLEEKEVYLSRGYKIIEEYIEDENVSSREEKAVKNTEIIKKHFFLGSGPGINQIMTDYEHNANNLFLEWWSGWGLLSLVSLIGFIFCLTVKAFKIIFDKKDTSAALILSGLAAFIIVNMFNASNLLAFAWLYLAWLSSMVDFSFPFKKNN